MSCVCIYITAMSAYPSGKSLSNNRLQSTTCPPVPIRSLDWRLTIKIIKELLITWHPNANCSYIWKRNGTSWRTKLSHVLGIFSFPQIKELHRHGVCFHTYNSLHLTSRRWTQVKAEKGSSLWCCHQLFSTWDRVWHSSGGSRVTGTVLLPLLMGELLKERAKQRNSCLVLTPPYVFSVNMGFNTHMYTHKARQNLTARRTTHLIYWLLWNTGGKKSTATLTQSSSQHPEKPLLPSAKLYYCFLNIIFIFYMFHWKGYLCPKLLYYNYEIKDFILGSFCSQYHNLQVSNLIVYDTCVPVGLLGFFWCSVLPLTIKPLLKKLNMCHGTHFFGWYFCTSRQPSSSPIYVCSEINLQTLT